MHANRAVDSDGSANRQASRVPAPLRPWLEAGPSRGSVGSRVGCKTRRLVVANDLEFSRCLVLAHQTQRTASAALLITSHEAQRHMPRRLLLGQPLVVVPVCVAAVASALLWTGM